MPIKPEEITAYLGIEADSMDQFKEKFDPEFVRKSLIKDPKSDVHKELFPLVIGKFAGTVQKDFIHGIKDMGIELAPEEVKDKKVEDIIKLGLEKAKDFYSSKIADYESKVGQGKDEAVKEWETKYTKLTDKFTQLDGLHKTLQQTYESEKGGFQNQIKGIRLENIIAKENEKIKWNTAAKPLEKDGFFANLEKNYKRDLDETGNLEIFDSKGQRIPNPAKAGTWMSYSEILKSEAEKAGLWEQNPHQQKNTPPAVFSIGQQQNNQQLPNQPVRKLSSKVRTA